ncbi:MAG: hypothetical protein U0836_16055 [Pirellulales bacterium]
MNYPTLAPNRDQPRKARFRLRTLLIVVTVFAVFFAFIGDQIAKLRRQPALLEQAVALAKSQGHAHLRYDYDMDVGSLSYEGRPMSLELARAIVAAKRIRELSTKCDLDPAVRRELERAFRPNTAKVDSEEARFKYEDGEEFEKFREEFADELKVPGRHRDGTQDWQRKEVGIFWAPFP